MTSMTPWHPDEIKRLTILQLICMSSKDPVEQKSISSSAEWEEVEKVEGRWNGQCAC
jgi:hypothetical protein